MTRELPDSEKEVGSMEPFDLYPKGGKELLGGFGRGYTIRGNTRKIRGPHFMRKTRQTACAYCGLSFVESFENWLQMQLDHVVPRKVCQDLGMFVESVLCAKALANCPF